MRPSRNQPENTPRGRFRCTPAERLATTFISGRRTTGFISALPAGVLARLLARKKRSMCLKVNDLTGQGTSNRPIVRLISQLKYRF